MTVPDAIVSALQPWADLHASASAVSVGLTFLHLAGLMVGGGAASVTDWHVLRTHPPEARAAACARVEAAHGVVRGALVLIVVTGAAMAASDVQVYAESTVFLAKMTLVGVLMGNGILLQRAAAAGPVRWSLLSTTAAVSVCTWLALVLAGALLEVSA